MAYNIRVVNTISMCVLSANITDKHVNPMTASDFLFYVFLLLFFFSFFSVKLYESNMYILVYI